MSIPKTIHYCWFGGKKKPENTQRCIESWKKHCPDYEIIEWNESNCDLNCCAYVREAYDAGKWAFVSDVLRLQVLVEYGGIYMDTDVEVLKPLDDILRYAAVSGFETRTEVMTGFMACEKGHPMYLELLRSYENAHFIKKDGTYDVTTNVARITNLCLGYGLKANNTFQIVNGITLFPKEYFSPKSFDSLEYEVTKNTYTVHHFDGSWLSEEDGLALNIKRKYAAYMPKKLAGAVARFLAALHFRGIRCAVKEIVLRIMKEV